MARSENGSGTLILTEWSLPPASVKRVTLTIKNWCVDFFLKKFLKKKKERKEKWNVQVEGLEMHLPALQ